MTTLEQLEQELEQLKTKIESYKSEGMNSKYPKVGETYYCTCNRNDKLDVVSLFWDDCNVDKYNWHFRNGSLNSQEVEWKVKHLELIKEIKKHTEPFNVGKENWCFIRTFKYGVEELNMNRYVCTDVNSPYGYFKSENEINKFKYNHDEEYIFKFLFEPIDGDYEAVMNWFFNQEEIEMPF